MKKKPGKLLFLNKDSMDKLIESLTEAWKAMEGAGFDSEVAADFDPNHLSQQQLKTAQSLIAAINDAHKKNIIVKIGFPDGSKFPAAEIAAKPDEIRKMMADVGADIKKEKLAVELGNKVVTVSVPLVMHVLKNIDTSVKPKSEMTLLAQEVLDSSDIGAYESFGSYAFDTLNSVTKGGDEVSQKVAQAAQKRGVEVGELALQLAYIGWNNYKKANKI